MHSAKFFPRAVMALLRHRRALPAHGFSNPALSSKLSTKPRTLPLEAELHHDHTPTLSSVLFFERLEKYIKHTLITGSWVIDFREVLRKRSLYWVKWSPCVAQICCALSPFRFTLAHPHSRITSAHPQSPSCFTLFSTHTSAC